MELPATPDFALTGRRALVIGGTKGIGLGASTVLARAGAHVTVVARTQADVTATVDALREEGHQAEAMVFDIADIAQMQAQIGAAEPFDILVNSAGTYCHTPALDTQPDDFDAVMGVNLRGAYFAAQAVAQGLMGAGKPGSIITLSSQMGHIGGQERAVYCASKHAVEGFTKVMAIEWGKQGIRVNTIAPTFIKTPLTAPILSDPEKHVWVMGQIKLARLGEVSDIAGAVLYLASDASAMVTGTSLLVDGGWTAS